MFAEDVDGGDAVLGNEGGGRGAEEVCRLRFAIRASASNEATFSNGSVRRQRRKKRAQNECFLNARRSRCPEIFGGGCSGFESCFRERRSWISGTRRFSSKFNGFNIRSDQSKSIQDTFYSARFYSMQSSIQPTLAGGPCHRGFVHGRVVILSLCVFSSFIR